MKPLLQQPFSDQDTTIDEALEYINKIRKVHTVLNNKLLQEETFFNAFVWLGSEIFDVELAIISNIQGQDYRIKGIAAEIKGLKKDMTLNLSDTICLEVMKTKKNDRLR